MGHRVAARGADARERLGFLFLAVGGLAAGGLYAVATLRGAPPGPALGGPLLRLFGALGLVSLAAGALAAGGLVVGRVRERPERPTSGPTDDEVLDRSRR